MNDPPTTSLGDISVADEGDAPTMEYYPRKYLSFGSVSRNLTVIVVAQDLDGVNTVMMNYRNSHVLEWNHSLLTRETENTERYRGTLQFKANSSSPEDSVTIQVIYIANDTLNNIRQSPMFEFTMEYAVLTVDGTGPLYDTPDLWYLVGTVGHEITWATSYDWINFHPYTKYTLHKDDLLLEHYQWSGELTINVDNLELGDHEYHLDVRLGAWGSVDNVTVHVVEELPLGVPTDSVWPITTTTPESLPLTIQTIVIITSCGIIIVGTILIISKKKGIE